jgi:hypothetical protein
MTPKIWASIKAIRAISHQFVQCQTAIRWLEWLHHKLSITVLNTFGPLLAGLAVPLLTLWNRSPSPVIPATAEKPVLIAKVRADTQIQGESIIAGLGIMIYYAALLLGAAVSAAILRRHLMVWKVFPPRFMFAVTQLLIVDAGVLIGFGLVLRGLVDGLLSFSVAWLPSSRKIHCPIHTQAYNAGFPHQTFREKLDCTLHLPQVKKPVSCGGIGVSLCGQM